MLKNKKILKEYINRLSARNNFYLFKIKKYGVLKIDLFF